MNIEYSTIIGSGTLPHIGHGLAHNIPEGTYPVPCQSAALRARRGSGSVILNPEDFSVSLGIRSSAITVTSSAVALPVNPLENRRALVVHNNGVTDIFLGESTVTVDSGLPLSAGEKIAFDIQNTPNVTVYAICVGSCNVRIMELS